ncbi:GroES-like protein [Violaceomyces palustris]|uniref:GroES-like protein n=1 Tax=Violaceomyces palustris TaxID=1673888 RepID=A0ACD0P251_9BASI|nr:GroES-like protein [Violaceomyces palustris]
MHNIKPHLFHPTPIHLRYYFPVFLRLSIPSPTDSSSHFSNPVVSFPTIKRAHNSIAHTMSGTMKALVTLGPENVQVLDRPIPRPKDVGDVVVKVHLAALCGSDLHIYRGHQPVPHYDFILGHEFVGEIHEVGEGVSKFKKGDQVVCPFTVSCGECFYCTREQTSRCVKSKVFGSVVLDGAQAEYVLVPLADTSLYPMPDGVPPHIALLMADIFPTGYFVASNGYKILNEAERKDATCVVVGCGPVGLCAVTAAKSFFKTVFAVDSVPERLAEAKKHGAIPLHLTEDDLAAKVKEATDGRGADVVCEVVGAESALHLAVELVRPWGVVSSCGIHTHSINLKGLDLYNKNIRFQFGRCPVRALFKPAIELLAKHHDLFDSFIQNTVSIDEAPKYYKLFNDRKVLKTVFKFD